MVRKTGPNNHNNAGESGRWQTAGQAAVGGAGAAEVVVVVIYKSPARFPYGNLEEGRGNERGRRMDGAAVTSRRGRRSDFFYANDAKPT